MKKFKIFLIVIFTSFAFLVPSCDFLDIEDYYEELMPYDSVFANTRNLQRYLWSIPAAFEDEGDVWAHTRTPAVFATDEGYTSFNASYVQFRGIMFMSGKVSADNLHGMDSWGAWYQIIRRCNILLSRMYEASDLTPSDALEISTYARFMRAYSYYLLMMNWGPVVLIGDEVMENNGDSDYYNRYRATMDETIDYICEELEEIAPAMPIQILESQFGRPGRGAAYGLIARLRLYQASPLFNGGDVGRRYFGSWTRSVDGVHYISQTYDERRWAVAAAAAKRIIDMEIYQLHIVGSERDTPDFPDNISKKEFPYGIGGIDPFRSYAYMFNGETTPSKVREYIWGRVSQKTADRTRNSFPKELNGYNGLCVTQKVIDNYRMIDGRDINDSSVEYPYRPNDKISASGKKFSDYTLNNDISGMYVDREMRFYASIGFSRRFWPGLSSTEGGARNFTATYDLQGNSGKAQTNNAVDFPATGYVLTKFIHNDDNYKGTGAGVLKKGWPIIRYAEILLAYVEAMNNLTETYEIPLNDGIEEVTHSISRDTEAMEFYFNQVRYRAGLPGLTNEELASKDEMQKLMEREMMIEFLHENRRYYDTRRWGIYEREESQDIMGMNMNAKEPEFYIPVRVDHVYARQKVVHPKMMFMPLPRAELNRALNLDQNPGW